MENQINTGTLDALKSGQTLLVAARVVNGGKIQLEFAEVMNAQQGANLLAMFNSSDERFQTKARRAWISVQPDSASELLGINFLDQKNYQVIDDKYVFNLNVLNPTVNGERLRIQITESVTPFNQWDHDNIDTRAKRKGKGGEFVLHKGQYIFTQINVVIGEAKHTTLEADQPVITGITAAKAEAKTANTSAPFGFEGFS
jgi:hypothetical protein